MTDRLRVICAAAVAAGVIMFAVTGALWQFIPITLGIGVAWLAAEADPPDQNDKTKGGGT